MLVFPLEQKSEARGADGEGTLGFPPLRVYLLVAHTPLLTDSSPYGRLRNNDEAEAPSRDSGGSPSAWAALICAPPTCIAVGNQRR